MDVLQKNDRFGELLENIRNNQRKDCIVINQIDMHKHVFLYLEEKQSANIASPSVRSSS